MKYLILEPGYFPSLRSFAAVLKADHVILADNVRFRKKSVFNRTRVRNAVDWQWLSIPLLPKMRKNPIYKVKIESKSEWATTHKRGLDYNYRTSPYYEHFEARLVQFFATERPLLGDTAFESMKLALDMINLDIELSRASDLDNIPVNMNQLLEFTLEKGGDLLLEPERWWFDSVPTQNRIVYNWKDFEYQQNFEGFQPGMSILDLIFNYGPGSIAQLKKGLAID